MVIQIMTLCDYGCEQQAKYQFKNGKFCCGSNVSKCPHIQNVMSKKLKGRIFSKEHKHLISQSRKPFTGENHPLYGKIPSDDILRKRGLALRLSIEKIKQRYPFFSKIEDMRYNPDKQEEKEIQVHCKNSSCPNSKEKGGWFTPDTRNISERIRQLEKSGKDNCYFYCSTECKKECPLYYSMGKDPDKEADILYTQEEHEVWRQTVLEQDNYECQKCNSKKELHCHHINPVKTYPHLALDPENGIVLCKNCHYEIGHKDECNTSNLANIKQTDSCRLGSKM